MTNAQRLLTRLVSELPTRRDWLDPDLETLMRAEIAQARLIEENDLDPRSFLHAEKIIFEVVGRSPQGAPFQRLWVAVSPMINITERQLTNILQWQVDVAKELTINHNRYFRT